MCSALSPTRSGAGRAAFLRPVPWIARARQCPTIRHRSTRTGQVGQIGRRKSECVPGRTRTCIFRCVTALLDPIELRGRRATGRLDRPVALLV